MAQKPSHFVVPGLFCNFWVKDRWADNRDFEKKMGVFLT